MSGMSHLGLGNSSGSPLGEDPMQQETLSLLQEEIAFLEHEIRLRDEALDHLRRKLEEEKGLDHTADRKLSELTEELERREESIRELFEELRLIEEAEVARENDLDELRRYIDELEVQITADDKRRFVELLDQVEQERKRAEALRLANETERRSWEAQRRSLEEQLAELRAQTSSQAPSALPPNHPDLLALEEENRLLKLRIQELNRDSAAAAELHAVRSKFETVRARLDRSHVEVERLAAHRDLDGKSLELELELEAERRRGEALRQSFEAERRNWELQRKLNEEEVQRLRAQLAEIAKSTEAQVHHALAALEDENRAIRQRCQELTRNSATAAELEAVRRDLEAVRSQLDAAQEEVQRLVEARDQDTRNIQVQLELERLKSDALRQARDSQRKTWDQQRRALEEEVKRLREELAAAATRNTPDSAELVAALEQENQMLRDRLRDQGTAEHIRVELEAVRLELRSAQAQLDQAHQENQRLTQLQEQERAHFQTLMEQQKQAMEADRHAIAVRVKTLENQNQQLRWQLDEAATLGQSKLNATIEVLEEEVRQLRAKLARHEPEQYAPAPAPNPVAPLLDLKSVRAKLDKSQEEIQRRMYKLSQLRGIHRRLSSANASTNGSSGHPSSSA